MGIDQDSKATGAEYLDGDADFFPAMDSTLEGLNRGEYEGLPLPPPPPNVPQVPIAIVGIGCRLPGGNSSPSKLWDFLCEGKSSWKAKAPEDRFNWDAFTHPTDPDFDGTFQIAGGHFHGPDVDLSRFDAAFFGLPQSEARVLDPQQKLLLETSYECLESGGIPMESLAGRKIGCFVAFSMGEYGKLWDKDLEYHQNYHAVGTGEAIYANRLSHVYDLAGPSMAFDTGCSGSMVGLDVACRYLSAGLIEGSFVGGTNLTLIPEVLGRKPRLLSKSGQCHTFDSLADGFSRADATSIVYVKRLDDAIRDRDPIRAIIRGSSNGFDGKTPGILMPSKSAQIENILQAYANAGIRPQEFGETAYFECHGTGTPTGDPIEVDAIGTVFAKHKSVAGPLLIGSAKTNLGHSEAASALTHIIKASLILQTGLIPPTVGIQNFNQDINFRGGRIKVVQELMELPKDSRKRISIQAFGYGGANSHTIIEAAEDHISPRQMEKCAFRYSQGRLLASQTLQEIKDQDENASSRPYLMLLSANDGHSLTESAHSLRNHVMESPSLISRLDLAYTLAVRKSKLFHRGFSILSSHAPIETAFEADAITSAKREHMAVPRIGFILTGQGAQRPRMGAALIENFVSVRATLSRLDKYLAELPPANQPNWYFAAELLKAEGESRVHEPSFAQPLTCALQIAVINLLASWGVKPSAGVVGHSSGEISAAYAAGLLSERQAITIAYFRGFSITDDLQKEDKLWADAGMLAVGLGNAAAHEHIKQFVAETSSGSDLVVACDNSPESVTVSGAASALDALAQNLTAKGIFARKLRVTKAYHNPTYMGRYSLIFKDALTASGTFAPAERSGKLMPLRKESVHPPAPAPMFSSSRRAARVQACDVQDPEYWRCNMEGAVLFTDALSTMLSQTGAGPQILIEIGPSSALKGPVRQTITAASNAGALRPEDVPKYIATLVGGSNAAEDVLRTVGHLFTLGCPVDLEKVNAVEREREREREHGYEHGQGVVTHESGRLIVDLPNYSWNKSRAVWNEPRASRNHRFKRFRRHEILGSRVPDDNPLVPTWRNFLSLSNTPWVVDHKLNEDIVFPAAGYITMAIEALRQLAIVAAENQNQNQNTDIGNVEIEAFELRHIHIKSALVLNAATNPEGGVYTFTTLTRENADSRWYSFSICSQPPAPSDRKPGRLSADESRIDLHCHGQIAVARRRVQSSSIVIRDLQEGSKGWTGNQVSGRTWYSHFSRIGFNYTNTFQVVKSIRSPAAECQPADAHPAAETILNLPDATTLRSEYIVTPPIIDGLLQALLATSAAGKPGALRDLAVPTKIDGLYVAAPTAASQKLACYSHIIPEVQDSEASKDGFLGSAQAFDELDGHLVVAVDKLSCTKINQTSEDNVDSTHVHKVVWKPELSLLGSFEVEPEHGSLLDVLFDLLGHQDPASTWLEIANDHSNALVATQALNILAPGNGYPRTSSYTIAAKEDDITLSELVEKLQNDHPAANVSFKSLEIPSSGPSDPSTSQYDVVVARIPSSFAEVDILSWLRSIQSQVNSGGSLVLLQEQANPHSSVPSSDLRRLIDTLGLQVDAEFSSTSPHRAEGISKAIILKPIDLSALPNRSNEASKASSASNGVDKITRTLSSILSGESSLSLEPSYIHTPGAIVVLATLHDPDLLANMSSSTWELIKSLVAEGVSAAKPVIWLTQRSQVDALGPNRSSFGPSGAMAVGFSRVLSKEEPELVLLTVDIDASTDPSTITERLTRLAGKVTGIYASAEREFAIRNGIVYTNRIVPDISVFKELHPDQEPEDTGIYALTSESAQGHGSTANGFEWHLKIRQVGLLQTLAFEQTLPSELEQPLAANDVEVEMRAVGVNFKDVAICMGILPHKNFGLEYSGVISRVGSAVTHLQPGQRVAGLPSLHQGAYRSLIRAPAWLCFEIPASMSFEEAATMPCVYFTVIHSLIIKANLQPGQSILIHSGAGGVGISAIQIARYLKAGQIFVTCGSEEKRKYLVGVMGIKPENIFNSRNDSFVHDIRRATNGRGVDVVLNSLSGDLLDASWSCVADTGNLVDVSRVDFLKRHRLQMQMFCHSVSFHAVDASQVMTFPDQGGRVTTILSRLAKEGHATPIKPMQTYGLDEIEAAFRLMQSGRSHGKLVISRKVTEGKRVKIQPCQVSEMLSFPSNATYLLIGCLGGIGRAITRRMFDKGARSFIMLSPSGDSKPAAKELVSFLRSAGALVTVIKGQVERMEDIERAISTVPVDRPLRGVVHSAMVLRDAPFSASTPSDFRAVADPKVHGAYNLHRATLSLPDPKSVDFFIMLSSVSGVFGQFGQSSYAAGNTYLDALAAHRHQLGLASSSLDLGFVEDVGWTTQNEDLDARMAAMGILAVRVKEDELLSLIELEMRRYTSTIDVKKGSSQAQRLLGFDCPAQKIFGLTSLSSRSPKSYAAPRLRALLHSGAGGGQSSSAVQQSGPAAILIQQLKIKSPAPSLLTITPPALEALLQKMSEFLLVPVEDIDAGRSPENFGVDSLVAVELRTWLKDSFGVVASTMEILKAPSFRSLAEVVAKKLIDKVQVDAL
ncbi:uncharacterized protein RSE6_03443 [Rhynchosporium secalis]|uniref:Uncharacterized protein n=1 Tax=Rhynchosporium secalis TaxID=38038 RepID=A0A1E1M2T3_RHYSE|nr:uncharacterized protein RSE6_03443 [Rhynchosporium secalis]